MSKKFCHLSNNSTTADSSFGCSHTQYHYTSCFSNKSCLPDSDFGRCSSVDIKTSPEEDSPTLEEPPPNNELPTLERQLTFQNGPLIVDDPQSMSDSASTLVCSESMPSFYSSSTTPNDQPLQTTPSSPSGVPTPSSVAPLPGPRISRAQINEAMTRIDTCLAQNRDRISVIDNDHADKFVQQSLLSSQKTEDQLEAPYPFLPRVCIPEFDVDCVQGCQLMAPEEFGNREQLYYQQMITQPLPEEEGVIERHLTHRNSVKQVRLY